MKRILSAVAAGGLLWAGLALAAEVTDVSPAEGTVGTEVVVTGSGFGTSPKTTKVSLVAQTAGAKGGKAKLTSVSDSEIRIEVQKVQPGVYDLVVAPKGEAEVVAEGAFTARAPDAQTFTAEVTPGGELTIGGQFFGSAKGKVKVGGKSAKVLSWTDTEIRVAVSGKLQNGPQDVEVQGKGGSETTAGATTVTGAGLKPVKGKDKLSGKLGGSKLVAKGVFLVGAPAPLGFDGFTLTATRAKVSIGGAFTQNLQLTIAGALVGPYPKTIGGGNVVGLYSESRGGIGGVQQTTWTPADNLSVTVDNVVGNRVTGTISGTMTRQNGTGGDAVIEVSASFTVTIVGL